MAWQKTLLLASATVLFSLPSLAATSPKSYSTGHTVTNETKTRNNIEQTKQNQQSLAALLTKPSDQQLKKAGVKQVDSYGITSAQAHAFEIYDVTTRLHEDNDYDGFYHQFSLKFDADTSYEVAHVYAVLYLSRDGGPWQHYYTTDNFALYGDSSLDAYEVDTVLADGFPTDSYDVLIELYQVGDNYPVASLSYNDTSALYSLPLEDQQRDTPAPAVTEHYYVEVESHGGSINGYFIALLVIIGIGREFIRHRK